MAVATRRGEGVEVRREGRSEERLVVWKRDGETQNYYLGNQGQGVVAGCVARRVSKRRQVRSCV